MTINIQDKEVTLKYTFRSLLIYESIQHKSFNPESLTDLMVYIYSTILASDKSLDLDFDYFLEWMDENPSTLTEFSEWLQKQVNKQAQLSPEPKDNNKAPKKK